jgi:hypothetical protein
MPQRTAGELTDRILAEVVRGRSRSVPPIEALRELLRRDAATRPLLRDVVLDRERPADVRATAAVALSHDPTPSAREALTQALDDEEPTVVRRAAEALGKIGDKAALARLDRVVAPTAAARRSVDFARTLISYRLGLDTHRLRQPPARSLLEVRPQRAEELRPSRIDRRQLPQIMENAEGEIPGVPLDQDTGVEFRCGDHRFVVVLTRHLRKLDNLAPLGRTGALVGALLERSPSTDRYFLSEYLLSDPGPRGSRARIFGVRPTGVIAHVGELSADAGSFEVRAVDARVSPPVAIEGSYDPAVGRLSFSRMLVERDFAPTQRAPAAPTKIDPDLD